MVKIVTPAPVVGTAALLELFADPEAVKRRIDALQEVQRQVDERLAQLNAATDAEGKLARATSMEAEAQAVLKAAREAEQSSREKLRLDWQKVDAYKLEAADAKAKAEELEREWETKLRNVEQREQRLTVQEEEFKARVVADSVRIVERFKAVAAKEEALRTLLRKVGEID